LLELVRSPQYVLRVDFERRAVFLWRSTFPFVSVEELNACFDRMIRALATVDRPRFVLLVDVRIGPSRTDPEFERAFAVKRRALVAEFAKVAVIVKTLGGRVQVQRHAQADQLGMRDFDKPELALAFLGIDDMKL
jgi:hypothetical protein